MTTESIPFTDFAAEALALYRPPLRRPGTYRKLRQVLAEFAALCGTTAELSPAAVARWIAEHPGRRLATVRTLLSTFRAATRHGEASGYLRCPFRTRPLARCLPRIDDEPIDRHLSTAQVARVLLQADREAEGGDWRGRRLRTLIYLAAYTGARAAELLALRVEDLDLAEGLVWIRPNARRALKTRSSRRRIPIPAPLRRVLEEWVGRGDGPSPWLIPHTELTGPWLSGAPRNKPLACVRALGERAGVAGVTLLAFRHAFASAADAWQVGPKALQDLMGHSSPATQWGYRHADLDQLRTAADRIRF